MEIYEETPGNDMVTFKSENKYMDLLSMTFLNDIPNEKIKLNSKVTKIENTPNGIEIQFNDDEVMNADYVIFTASLGVLKSDATSLFQPKLSSDKMSAIEKLGMGNVVKIYLEFDQIWWSVESEGISVLYDQTVDYSSPDLEWTRGILGIYR